MRRCILALVTSVMLVTLPMPAGAAAAVPGLVAFARDGDIWVSTDGGAAVRITRGGGSAWPRLSPDRTRIAYVHRDDIWITDPGGNFAYQVTSGGDAGAPAWSPQGDYLAYRAGDVYTGTLFLVRVSSQPRESVAVVDRGTCPANAGPEALPAGYCQAISEGSAAEGSAAKGSAAEGSAAKGGAKGDGLREANTVAWSPDGRFIAFPGGECWGIYDECLTVLNVDTNAESTVAAWGGGGSEMSGFATTPAWSSDSAKLFWTQQVEDGPTTIQGYRPGTSVLWQIGRDGDAMPVPLGHGRFLVVADDGWITLVTGRGRTALFKGTQPDV